MKKSNPIFAFILVIFITGGTVFAQPIQGKKFEFSTSASIWIVKFRRGETETVINLPLRLGYFINKSLEIEPELFLTFVDTYDEIGYLILGNISYNFNISKKITPFVLAGGGYGNSEQNFSLAYDFNSDIFALNLGAGMKIPVGSAAAVRVEYRFIKYFGEEDWFDRTDHTILVGFSIFFSKLKL